VIGRYVEITGISQGSDEISHDQVGSLKMNTALEYSTRVVQDGGPSM
jgi:hypothetical protein